MKGFSSAGITVGAVFAGLWLALVPVRPAPDAPAGPAGFTGHYELADRDADRTFSLDVMQAGAHADLAFSASMNDGSGAAPDGEGRGAVGKSGALAFTFSDSFGNEGTGTLAAKKDGYHLSLTPVKVVEARAVRFYGDMVMRKTADKPQPPGG